MVSENDVAMLRTKSDFYWWYYKDVLVLHCWQFWEREWEPSKLSFLLRCGLRALLTHNMYRWQEVYVHVMYSLYILMHGCMMAALCWAQHSQFSCRCWMKRHSTFKVQISSVVSAWYFASHLMKLCLCVDSKKMQHHRNTIHVCGCTYKRRLEIVFPRVMSRV